ncbi:hypothetical protein BC938DRAFT_471258 [Jimgerdemannia flammicorona]|uniref:Uncharacterized protein n=1 Tax=Jimgerdemannia flammicorona TaxID=994334 RepID=A0A433Q8G7_9FUNG|nr:hypothetical protein BC938DRAFT_471258 [Jimgerdemannia flammicorona]
MSDFLDPTSFCVAIEKKVSIITFPPIQDNTRFCRIMPEMNLLGRVPLSEPSGLKNNSSANPHPFRQSWHRRTLVCNTSRHFGSYIVASIMAVCADQDLPSVLAEIETELMDVRE